MFVEYSPMIEPDNNSTIQVEQHVIHEAYTSSTKLNKTYYFSNNDISSINKNTMYSTDFMSEKSNETNSSTWEEFIANNFDIISKLSFKKEYKLKSKIKTITKYSPKIVIE